MRLREAPIGIVGVGPPSSSLGARGANAQRKLSADHDVKQGRNAYRPAGV